MLSIFNFSRRFSHFVLLILITFGVITPLSPAESQDPSTNNTELCAIQPSGFVGWYKGEGNIFDSTHTSGGERFFNGTYLAGKVGQAFNFDGTNLYAALRTNDTFIDKITLATWIKPTSTNGSETRL